MIIILAIYGTWAVISAFLNCIPVAKFWDPTLKGHCLSKPALWFSNASMHITTDLVIFFIPIPPLITIDVPKRQKIALILMFGMGGLCVIPACLYVSQTNNPSVSASPASSA
jgi:hypothetical protein